MVAGLVVQPFESLPEDIQVLLRVSREEGHKLVERLADDWQDGSNRFDRPGEVALEVRLDSRLVGVGGLNRDPYLDDPAVGRIRHVYVSPDARRLGVGRVLVLSLVEHARGHFSRVRLRTGAAEASGFYMRLGFEVSPDEPDATHQLVF